jgi:hypothetical protein
MRDRENDKSLSPEHEWLHLVLISDECFKDHVEGNEAAYAECRFRLPPDRLQDAILNGIHALSTNEIRIVMQHDLAAAEALAESERSRLSGRA